MRITGLVRLFWPFVLGIFVTGYLVRCALAFPPIPPFAAGFALLALASLLWWFQGRALQRFGDFLKGARGEELVARDLALLPAGFEVFHGVPDPADGGDLDHVVLGPGGIAVVETKHWSGPVSYADGELLAQGRRPSRSPISQVRRASAGLRRHLASRGCHLAEVRPVICFAGDSLEADVLVSDELTLCNRCSLCIVLLREIGTESLRKDLRAEVGRELRALAGR